MIEARLGYTELIARKKESGLGRELSQESTSLSSLRRAIPSIYTGGPSLLTAQPDNLAGCELQLPLGTLTDTKWIAPEGCT